jgi:hypothetical protein
MFTKDEFKSALGEETRLTCHLASKLGDVAGDYSPGEGMRTLDELLRYIAACGIAPAVALVKNDWDVIAPYQERVAELTLDGFEAAMGRQMEELATVIDDIPDADFADKQVGLPWGATSPLGYALYETSVRFMVAYRMQLFLYAKQAGHTELNTYNAWLGQDEVPGA